MKRLQWWLAPLVPQGPQEPQEPQEPQDPLDSQVTLKWDPQVLRVHLESQVLAHLVPVVIRENQAALYLPQKPSSPDPQGHLAPQDLKDPRVTLDLRDIKVNQASQAYLEPLVIQALGIQAHLAPRDLLEVRAQKGRADHRVP